MLEKYSREKIDVPEGNARLKYLLKEDCVGFVTAVIINLAARFPPTQQGIVEAAKIFDPKALPTDDTITTYGEEALDKLALHYPNFVDRTECQSEWDMLKQYMKASYKDGDLLT